MSNFQLKTPVAFFIFRRPDTTERVFEVIRQAKPPKLLVISDAPRPDRPGEAEKCAASRAIIDRVDWDCEVIKNYADVNMGMKLRQASGFDWIFNTVEEAIILEDDTLPHPTFFRFGEELLEKYRDDERIMMISGTNFLKEWKSDIQSYNFAYFGSTWGWASWRRAWKYYDIQMKLWSKSEVKNRVRDIIYNRKYYLEAAKLFDDTYTGKLQTWDYQWDFARFINSGLSVIPSKNLISNIGFGKEAVNTFKDYKGVSNLAIEPMSFPLRHPYSIAVDREYDHYRCKKTLGINLIDRISFKLRSALSIKLGVNARAK
jgi:hypothetical protein